MKRWQLQEAKAKLSEVVREAMLHGPQTISIRGEDSVVMLAVKDYERLIATKPSFVEFMRASPLRGVELDIERDKSPDRDIDL